MSDLSFDDLPPEVAPPGIEPDEFTCDECGKVSKNARGLSMHKKRSHGDGSGETKSGPQRRSASLENDLKEFFIMISVMVSFINADDGAVIGQNAPALAHAYGNFARQNKPFRKFLEGMMQTGAIGEVFTVTLFTALPILGNHGKLPPELMNVLGGIIPNVGQDQG